MDEVVEGGVADEVAAGERFHRDRPLVGDPSRRAHMDPDAAAQFLRQILKQALDELSSVPPEQIIEGRYAKFRQMGGFFHEASV